MVVAVGESVALALALVLVLVLVLVLGMAGFDCGRCPDPAW
jgi:hypothetical protein